MKCHHAGSGDPDCGGEAVVLASETYGILRQDLPLCGPCAVFYAGQATKYATDRVVRGHGVVDVTITLRPVEENDG